MNGIIRKATRQVNAGGVLIGGGVPISVQTMTNAPAADVAGTLGQIRAAAEAGCALVRCAVPALSDVPAFREVAARSPLPVVADIHFDWRIALRCVEAGAAKIRINPGNMNDWDGLGEVLKAAAVRGVPIRIGVNGGSIRHKDKADARSLEEVLVAEALAYAARFEEMGFHDIVLSLKASDVVSTIRVNRLAAAQGDYPLHIGLTEAGLEEDALLKSAAALGALLVDGIGDTLRLSFTGEPVREVIAGHRLLAALGLERGTPELVSCPTCGRTRVPNLVAIAEEVRAGLQGMSAPLRVAVMGCEVNGPGEAKEADLGIAGTGSGFLLFVRGEPVRKLAAEEAVEALLAAARDLANGVRRTEP